MNEFEKFDKEELEKLKECFDELSDKLSKVFKEVAECYVEIANQLNNSINDVLNSIYEVEEKERLRQRYGRDKNRSVKIPDRRRLAALQNACLKHNGIKAKKRQYTRHRMEKKDFKSRALTY